MITLGLAPGTAGDAAAALFIDETLAAVSDERGRSGGAPDTLTLPWMAARECLQSAGVTPGQVDAIALTDSALQLSAPVFWQAFAREARRFPWQTAVGLVHTLREEGLIRQGWRWLIRQLGIETTRTSCFWVERTLAQAQAGIVTTSHRSAHCVLSGNDLLSTTALLIGKSHNGRFEALQTISPSANVFQLMRCMGAYLGFDAAQALEGIAQLARQGDPERYGLDRLFIWQDGNLQINLELFSPDTRRGWRHAGKRYPFTQRLVDWLGPPAIEGLALDPHAHFAATLQRYFEGTLQKCLAHSLRAHLQETPSLLLCGEAALARSIPASVFEDTSANSLLRSPFTGSKGAAIGAAAHVMTRHGILIETLRRNDAAGRDQGFT